MKIIQILVFILLPSTAFAWLEETSDKIWRSGWGQGTSEAQVTSGSGNEIYVACESGSGRYSSISFKLSAKPPKGENILLMFDREQPIVAPVDEDGYITSDSNAMDSVFQYVIERLKNHNNVYVKFTDGREATFTLKGAKKAIGHCKSMHEVDADNFQVTTNATENVSNHSQKIDVNKIGDTNPPSQVSTVISKTGDVSESGDGFSFVTKQGNEYYVYAAGNLTPGFKLLYESEEKGIEVCIRLNPEHGMGDVKSVSRGSCSSSEKSDPPQIPIGTSTGKNPLRDLKNPSSKTNASIKLKN